MKVLGTFYLKNGSVIKDEVVIESKDFSRECMEATVKEFKEGLERSISLSEKRGGLRITFGDTVILGSELVAFMIKGVDYE